MTPKEIQALRPARNTSLTPDRPVNFFLEEELGPDGKMQSSLAIFLTNRECPWKCVMCDLWMHTLPFSVQTGDVPKQIQFVFDQLEFNKSEELPKLIKLYNSGSFFDSKAIPEIDDIVIADLVRRNGFEKVVVECHPAFLGARALRFQEMLTDSIQLEVAMGLENVHPVVLEKMGKGVSREKYAEVAVFLKDHGMTHRSFVLVHPPYISDRQEAMEWGKRTLDFALIETGATLVSLIQTRSGNGAMEALEASGSWIRSSIQELEELQNYGRSLNAGRTLVDTWDLHPENADALESLKNIQRANSIGSGAV